MAGQDKILGEQLDIIDVSLDISTNPVAIAHIATGLTTDSGAIAIIDADYLRRDGTVTMDGTLTITGTHDLVVGGNISVIGTVDSRDILADAIEQTAHIADGTIHFEENDINHDNILNSGSLYSHTDIDTHIGLMNIHFTTLDGLSDVTTTSPTIGQILTYTSGSPAAAWQPQDPVTGIFDITAEPLGDLVDVILTGSPLLGQVLSYNGSDWVNSTPASGVTDHTLLTNIGTNTHAQIDSQLATAASHIADTAIHYTQGSIAITKSQVTDFNITAEPLGDLSDVVVAGSPLVTNQVLTYDGANWVNADVPTGITDHTLLTNIGTNTHAQIDTHIADGTVHFTQGSISITKSQVSDFDITAEPLGDLSDVVLGGSPLNGQTLTYDGSNWINSTPVSGVTDHTLLTNIGTNTHAQIDTHISDGTIHFTEASIAITKSQVTDFGITAEPLGDLSDVVLGGSPLTNQVLTYDGVNWINAVAQAGASALNDLTDVVIGGSPLTTDQVLTYDGANWINADAPTSITDHTLLTNIGTNTHAQIDTHISDGTIHYTQASIAITKSQVTDFGITAEPLGDLSDVVVAGSPLVTNQVLTFDGSNWVNADVPVGVSVLDDLTDVVIGGSPLVADQVLTYDGSNWINSTPATAITDHTLLTNIGTNTHAQIDTHIADATVHFTQAAISITKSQVTDFGITAEPLGDLSDVVLGGSPLNGQTLTYDGANWINSTPASGVTDHTLLTNIGTNTHAQIDTHISDSTIHFTEASIAITKSQVTDFDITAEPLGDLSDVVLGGSPLTADQVLTYDGANWINADAPTGITDHTLLSNIGTNTHAQIDTHISDGTIHYTQASISITKSQVTDFGITTEPLGDLSDVVLGGSPLNGQTLTYDGVNWINSTPASGVTDHTLLSNIGTNTHAQIDTHISDSTIHYTQASIAITKSQVTDFGITAEPLGDLSDVVVAGSPLVTNQVLTYDGANWVNADVPTGVSVLDDLTDVVIGGSPLTTDQVLTYDGVNWINADAPTSITDHTLLTNIGTNTHAQIDTHIGDSTIHYTQASIAITKSQVTDFGITAEPLGDLSDVVLGGSPLDGQTLTYDNGNWINSTPSSGVTDHTLLTNIGTNTHAQIDTHISDSTIHFTQAAISITKSQVTDFGITAEPLGDLSDVVIGGSPLTADQVLTYDGANWINADVPAGGEANDNWLVANGDTDFGTAPLSGDIGDNNIVIGNAAVATSSFVTNSVAIGTNADAGNHSAVAIGFGADASAQRAISIGVGSFAAYDGIAIGKNASSSGGDGHIAIGRDATASAVRSAAFGIDATCSAAASGSLSAGYNSSTSNINTLAVGRQTTASGYESSAFGLRSTADQVRQVVGGINVIGASTTTNVSYSLKLGYGLTGTNKNLLHLFSKGKLELYGDEAQFVFPNYAASGSPTAYPANPETGGTIYDSVSSTLKVYDGASWGDVAPAGGASVALNDLTDVVIGGSPLTADQVLTYDGVNWINADVAAGGDVNTNWIYANNGSDFVTTPVGTGSNSISIGNSATTVADNDAIAIGTSADGSGNSAVAIGPGAIANNASTIAIGDSPDATFGDAIAIGTDAKATDFKAIAFGYKATASQNDCIAIGTNSDATFNDAISIGSSSNALSYRTVAIGLAAQALSTGAVAIGDTAVANEAAQVSIGVDVGASSVTSDVGFSTKLGYGLSSASKNMLHLFSKGKLELYGDEAQFVFPNYAASGSPTAYPANPETGGTIYDSVSSTLKVYDGASWGDVAPASGGASALNDLTDVVIGGSPLTTDQVLTYDGANWINADSSSVFTEDVSDNIFGGNLAGNSLLSGGTFNMLMGGNAGTAITTGDDNICIGRDAGLSLTIESNNVLVGRRAGDGITDDWNTCIGTDAGFDLSGAASINVAIGASSMGAKQTGAITGSFNVGIGGGSGYNLTSGSNNVLIGSYRAGYKLSTGTYNICIGSYAGPTTNQSNQLFIDNIGSSSDSPLIHGNFSTNEVTIHGNLTVTGTVTGVSLNELDDVVIGGSPLTTDQVLTYDGINWVNADAGSGGVTDHTLLTNIGTNTHAQIDTHIAAIHPHNNWMTAHNGVDFTIAPIATGIGGIAIGHNCNTSTHTAATAIGGSCTATGAYSVAIGTTISAAANAIALGVSASATSSSSIAIGSDADATDSNAIAIGTTTNARNAADICIGQYAETLAGSYKHSIVIGRQAEATATSGYGVTIGGYASSALTSQVTIGATISGSDVTTDVANSVKIGTGVASVINIIHLFSKGKLELYGDEAQFIFPNYAASGSPTAYPANPETGGTIYDSISSTLKVYDGSTWGDVAPAGGGSVALNDLTDVVIGGSPLVADQVLTYDGANWINADVPAGVGEANNNWLIANNDVDFSVAPTATGPNAIAIGKTATSSFNNGISIGNTAETTGTYGIALGALTDAAASAIAVGKSANASGGGAISIGTDSDATNTSTIAIGASTNAYNAGDVVIGEQAIANAGGGFSVVIGRSASASTNVDRAVVIGRSSSASQDKQVSIGAYLNSADTTTDVSHSVKLGYGGGTADDNILHLFDAGKLELYGNKAQFIVPKYATSSEPASPLEGSLIYDSTTDNLKTYDGAAWNEVGGTAGGSTKPQYESITPTGSPPSEIINTTVPTVAIAGSPQLAGVQVFRNGMLQDEEPDLGGSPATITEDFVVSGANQITFASDILEAGDKIKIFAFT